MKLLTVKQNWSLTMVSLSKSSMSLIVASSVNFLPLSSLPPIIHQLLSFHSTVVLNSLFTRYPASIQNATQLSSTRPQLLPSPRTGTLWNTRPLFKQLLLPSPRTGMLSIFLSQRAWRRTLSLPWTRRAWRRTL
jgi:hypothetical protein